MVESESLFQVKSWNGDDRFKAAFLNRLGTADRLTGASAAAGGGLLDLTDSALARLKPYFDQFSKVERDAHRSYPNPGRDRLDLTSQVGMTGGADRRQVHFRS